MQEFETATRLPGACPVCQSRIENGDLFCPRCGNFLHGDNSNPEPLNLPLVHLLSQVCTLQKDLLHQYRSGQAVQARQFQKALQVQSEQFDKALRHAADQAQMAQDRTVLLVRWTSVLAGAAVGIVLLVLLLA
jgi:ElaB/YqjD/DUF883 family membrane-anchored ribosome-binding protein